MDYTIYNKNFHRNRDEITRYSAERILNIVNEIIDIKSCVDVGGD